MPRPGVLTKDFRQLDIDLEEVYSLNDLEEDDMDTSSFQLLPTSTPAKAKERPGGERGVRGRRGCGPRNAPALPRLPLASPHALPSCSSLSLSPVRPRRDAPSAAARGPFCNRPGAVSPRRHAGMCLLRPGHVEATGLGEMSAPVHTCARSPSLLSKHQTQMLLETWPMHAAFCWPWQLTA